MIFFNKPKPYIFNINSVFFTCLLALYFVCILNIPVLIKIVHLLQRLETIKFGFAISIPIFFVAVFNSLFTIFSIKHFEKPWFILLILLSSIMSYSTYFYGVVFDSDMIDNILKTNQNEACAYINSAAFIWISLFGILPSIIIYKIKIIHYSLLKDFFTKIIAIVTSLLIIAIIALLYYQDYASVKRNNSDINKIIIPLHFIYSSGKYIKKNYLTPPPIYKQLGLDAKNNSTHNDNKHNLLIFVVGETARSMNYQLNGYHRETNKYTSALNLISFKHVTSCGTNTAISIPCMFSKFTRDHYTAIAAKHQDSLLDVLQHAGLNVLWIDNNAGCYNSCQHVTTINTDPSKNAWCDGNTCVDEALLVELQNHIDSFKGKDSVIVLHAIGSHGPAYHKRMPEQHLHFKPNCLRSDIQNCTQEELLNTYDNSILYTDFVLSKIITTLKNNNEHWHTSVIYVSDHGESLGEKGLYLHGFPYNLAPIEQTHVPYLSWFSESFIKNKNINISCLQHKANTEHYSHDNIFSSILGLMDITTKEYEQQQDMFYECRK